MVLHISRLSTKSLLAAAHQVRLFQLKRPSEMPLKLCHGHDRVDDMLHTCNINATLHLHKFQAE